MQLSREGVLLIQGYEKLKLTAYQDSVSVWTIGWGHTKGVVPYSTCTLAQAEIWFLEDTTWVVECLNKKVTVPLQQNQFDALASWIFNLGCPRFSDLLPLLNQGHYEETSSMMLRYNKAKGVVLAGLTRRREDEVKLFRRTA